MHAADTTRPDDSWIEALRSDGPHSTAAQQELLTVLRAGLRRGMACRPEAQEWVDDFAQEAVTRVLKALPKFRGESRFSSWALAIAMRVAFDSLRHKRWKDVSLDALLAQGAQIHSRATTGPDEDMTRKRVLAILSAAMETSLTPRQRIALTAELKGVPQSELATRLNSNRNAVYKLTHDARRRLKHILAQEGITAEIVGWAFQAE